MTRRTAVSGQSAARAASSPPPTTRLQNKADAEKNDLDKDVVSEQKELSDEELEAVSKAILATLTAGSGAQFADADPVFDRELKSQQLATIER